MLVAVGVGSANGWVHQQYALSLGTMIGFSRKLPVKLALTRATSSIVANTRNHMVDAAMVLGADKLLMIDSDIIFPHDLLERLIAHDRPIVAVPYRRRSAPHDILANPEEAGDQVGLRPMLTMALGCSLISTSVFRDLGRPWWHFGDPYGRPEGVIGEDMTFCSRARDAGYRIMADCDINLGHVGEQIIWTEPPK